MNQTRINSLITTFSPELIQVTEFSPGYHTSPLTYVAQACKQIHGTTVTSCGHTGVIVDYAPGAGNHSRSAILFQVGDQKLKDNGSQVANIGLYLLKFLHKIEPNQVDLRLIFQSTGKESSLELHDRNYLDGVADLITISTNPSVPQNCVALKTGILRPRQREFSVRLSASPGSNYSNNILAVMPIISSWLSQLPTRKFDPLQPVRIFPKKISPAVLAQDDNIFIRCILQITNEEMEEGVVSQIEETIKGFAKSLDLAYVLDWEGAYPTLLTDSNMNLKLMELSSRVFTNGQFVAHTYAGGDHNDLPYPSNVPCSVIYTPEPAFTSESQLAISLENQVLLSGVVKLLTMYLLNSN